MPCSCNTNPCSCSPCAPANTIYDATCTDPGITSAARHLSVLDSQFCERRMQNAAGFLVNRQNGSGGWQLGFTTEPNVALSNFTATTGQEFGNLLIQGADGVLRKLTGPATANLFMRTLATGELIFDVLPAASVPDPLTVGTLTVTGNTTLNNAAISGTTTMTGAASGTLVTILGLNGANEVISGTLATTTVQSVMFFESPTSPSAATPNSAVTAGGMLTIGNEISSSLPAGSLISVTNSQTLAVVQAGYYTIDYGGQVVMNANTAGTPSIQLLINGVNVNNGNSRAGVSGGPIRGAQALSGIHGRSLAVGDTIQLQIAAGSGSNISTYEVRLRATRIGA